MVFYPLTLDYLLLRNNLLHKNNRKVGSGDLFRWLKPYCREPVDAVDECENGCGFRVGSVFPSLLFFFLSILTEQIFVDSTKDHKGGPDPHTNGIIHYFAI